MIWAEAIPIVLLAIFAVVVVLMVLRRQPN
jgi:hypothetical protein